MSDERCTRSLLCILDWSVLLDVGLNWSVLFEVGDILDLLLSLARFLPGVVTGLSILTECNFFTLLLLAKTGFLLATSASGLTFGSCVLYLTIESAGFSARRAFSFDFSELSVGLSVCRDGLTADFNVFSPDFSVRVALLTDDDLLMFGLSDVLLMTVLRNKSVLLVNFGSDRCRPLDFENM